MNHGLKLCGGGGFLLQGSGANQNMRQYPVWSLVKVMSLADWEKLNVNLCFF